MKTQQAIVNRILALGWQLEYVPVDRSIKWDYRASQGGFYTLWRPTPEQVLQDVQAIKQARETCRAPF